MLPDEVLDAADCCCDVRHAGAGKAVTLATPPDPPYTMGSLTDGVLGGDNFQGPEWLGFEGRDVEASIDLGKPTGIRRLAAGFLLSTPAGIYLPPQVEFLGFGRRRWRIAAWPR